MDNQIVSVIITCFNQEKYIQRALKSVLHQTYSYWECIIVDDGSTDNSFRIISDFIDKDDRFKLIRQENMGVTVARNTGVSNATGNIIQILDGDDWIHDEKLERQLEYFRQYPQIDVSYVLHRFYFEQSASYEIYEFDRLKENPFEQFLFDWHSGVATPIHAFLFKRQIWDEGESLFPEDYIFREEDWVFHVLTAMKNIRYGCLEEVLCTYFNGADSFTSSIVNSCINSIDAAIYIRERIPADMQERFWRVVVHKILDRYHDSKKAEVLRSSKNWRLGNFISRPFFLLFRSLKRLSAKNPR